MRFSMSFEPVPLIMLALILSIVRHEINISDSILTSNFIQDRVLYLGTINGCVHSGNLIVISNLRNKLIKHAL